MLAKPFQELARLLEIGPKTVMEFLLTPGERKKEKKIKTIFVSVQNVLGRNGKTFHGNPELFT